jgi:hypothetical protein
MKLVTKAMVAGEYRTIADVPPVEWCSMTSSSNAFLSIIVDLVKKNLPALIHGCPYKVKMVHQRFSIISVLFCYQNFVTTKAKLDGKIFSMFPAGDYEATFNVSTSRKNFFSLKFLTHQTDE